MKKIFFLSAMVLYMVSAFATDTPAYAPHGLHPGYRPVYGHGIHLRAVHPAQKPFHLVAGHDIRAAFVRPMPVFKEAPSVQVSLPGFTEADATINEAAIMEMTKISLPGFADADAAINESAIEEMTEISVPGFSVSDAAINDAAIMEMTKISLPGFAEADAAINNAAIMEMTKISLPGFADADAEIEAVFNEQSLVVSHESTADYQLPTTH